MALPQGGVPQKRQPVSVPRSDSEVDEEQPPAIPMDQEETRHQRRDDESSVVSSPLSYQRAEARGINTQRIQVMKASFFCDKMDDKGHSDMELTAVAPARSSVEPRPVGSLLSTSLRRLGNRSHSRLQGPSIGGPPLDSLAHGGSVDGMLASGDEGKVVTSLQEEEFEEVAGAEESFIPPALFFPKVQLNFVLPASVVPLYGSGRRNVMIDDAATFLGRSFRVGWGPNWTLYHSGFATSSDGEDDFSIFSAPASSRPLSEAPEGSLPIRVIKEQVDPRPLQIIQRIRVPTFAAYEPLLMVQLHHSVMEERMRDNEVPMYYPQEGKGSLNEYASLARDLWPTDPQNSTHMWEVWQLCKALWGDLSEDEGAVGQTPSLVLYHAHSSMNQRKMAIVNGSSHGSVPAIVANGQRCYVGWIVLQSFDVW